MDGWTTRRRSSDGPSSSVRTSQLRSCISSRLKSRSHWPPMTSRPLSPPRHAWPRSPQRSAPAQPLVQTRVSQAYCSRPKATSAARRLSSSAASPHGNAPAAPTRRPRPGCASLRSWTSLARLGQRSSSGPPPALRSSDSGRRRRQQRQRAASATTRCAVRSARSCSPTSSTRPRC